MQNEHTLAVASEKLEQHMEQIESSNKRLLQKEQEAMDHFAQGLANGRMMINAGHRARMKGVISDINALKASITSSAEPNVNTQE
jgi:hypothetical protein